MDHKQELIENMDIKANTALGTLDFEHATCEQILKQANELAHRFFNLAGGTRHPEFLFYRGSHHLERMVWDQAKLVFSEVFKISIDSCFAVNGAICESRTLEVSVHAGCAEFL